MLGCEKNRLRLDDWLDGHLAPEAVAEVNDHLAFCEACRDLYRRHVELREDLAALGAAAERMVDEAARPAGRTNAPLSLTWRGLSRVAAAILLVVAAGYLLLLPRPQVVRQDTAPTLTSVSRAPETVQFIGDMPVTSADEERVRIVGAPDCLAVNVQSANPRVHIVWLYGSCASEPPESGDAASDHPNG